VKLVAKDHFRGFLIQARPASKNAESLSNLRAGEFVQDTTWDDQGIKFQTCKGNAKNSITHDGSKSRREIRVKWRIDDDVGSVQFV